MSLCGSPVAIHHAVCPRELVDVAAGSGVVVADARKVFMEPEVNEDADARRATPRREGKPHHPGDAVGVGSPRPDAQGPCILLPCRPWQDVVQLAVVSDDARDGVGVPRVEGDPLQAQLDMMLEVFVVSVRLPDPLVDVEVEVAMPKAAARLDAVLVMPMNEGH